MSAPATSPPTNDIAARLKQINSALDIFGMIILYVLPFFIFWHVIPEYVLPLVISGVYFVAPYVFAVLKKVATLVLSMLVIWIVLPMIALVLSVGGPYVAKKARQADSFWKSLSSLTSRDKAHNATS